MVRSRVASTALGTSINGLLIGTALIVGMLACASRATPPSPAGAPSRLGDQDAAQVDRSGSPTTIPGTAEWRFSEPQPDWKAGLPIPGVEMAGLERTTDAVRVTLSDGPAASGERPPGNRPLGGGVYIDLPDWRREEWAEVVVRARATSSSPNIRIGLNSPDGAVVPAGASPAFAAFVATFQTSGGLTPVVRDGLVHTYRIHLDWGSQRTGPWLRVGLWFEASARGQARASASIDILSVRVVPAATGPDQDRVTETTLQPQQLNSDFALFRRALEEAHPSLYRYRTKRDIDAVFAKAEATLIRPMTLLQFRNVLAGVLGAIKDGHGGFFNYQGGFTNYQGDEISTLLNAARQFPLVLTFESTRAFVVLNQGLDERVTPSMEVLAINGQSLAEILQRILPNLNQDGDGRTFKMYQLGISRGFFRLRRPGRAGFSEAYRLYVGNPLRFRTTVRDPRTRKSVVVDLAGVTPVEAAVNAELNPVNREVLAGLRTLRTLGPQQSIRYLDGEETAVLVPGFQQRFPDFLRDAFAALRSKGTKTLIIDMRGNTGGNDVYPGLLFSYLTSKEFRSNEPSYMKTFQPSYRGSGEIDPVTDSYYGSAAGIWKPDANGGWLMTEKYPMIGVRKPSENHFDGTVYVLMDGGSFSAGSAFCAIAAFHKRAIFIGEETGGVGGGASGNNGLTLPESHLDVSFPREAEFSVVDERNRRRGTLPTHVVMQTVDDLAKGRDTALEFTLELILSGKGRLESRPTYRR